MERSQKTAVILEREMEKPTEAPEAGASPGSGRVERNARASTAQGFPAGSVSEGSACNAGDLGSIPGSGRPPGRGYGIPLPYCCLENPMDRGAWRATVHGIAKSQT